MSKCRYCGAELRPNAEYCTKCGISTKTVETPNYCTNPSCIRNTSKFLFSPKEEYCDKCGSFTDYGKTIDDLT